MLRPVKRAISARNIGELSRIVLITASLLWIPTIDLSTLGIIEPPFICGRTGLHWIRYGLILLGTDQFRRIHNKAVANYYFRLIKKLDITFC